MGVFGQLWKSAREVIDGPQTLSPESQPASTPKALARELFAEFPDDISAEVLWRRCDAVGLSMADVDRELDQLRYDAEQRARIRVGRVELATLRVLDLTELASSRMRIVGTTYAVADRDREQFSGTEYLLVCEPENAHDASAIAVYGKGRRVGYVAASRAGTLSPLLGQLDADAFQVSGAGTGERGMRLWVDLPRADALRVYVKLRR